MTQASPSVNRVDAVIVGGGAAGLWLLKRLRSAGYAALLLEADKLGNGQTLASQGMIHGGLKYALGGRLTGASEAIAAMPARWRAAMSGEDPHVDLRGLEVLSEHNLLFADATSLGRLGTFFASRALRGRIRKLAGAERPPLLRHGDVSVYALDDLVLDTAALLERLQESVSAHAYRHQLRPEDVTTSPGGYELKLGATTIATTSLLLAAGAGNAALVAALAPGGPAMQRRPLAQVIVRHAGLPPFFGHCLTGITGLEPRLTISSHRDGDGWLWYLGGRLAGEGVELSDRELVSRARRELARCLPALDLDGAEVTTLRVDRAEPAHEGRRPDAAFAEAVGNLVVCWPTKLSLVPDLGDRVSALLPPPSGCSCPPLPLPPATLGAPPWER